MGRWRRLLVAVVIAWCCVAVDTPATGATPIEPIPPGRGLLDPVQVGAMLEGPSSTGWQPKGRTLYRVEILRQEPALVGRRLRRPAESAGLHRSMAVPLGWRGLGSCRPTLRTPVARPCSVAGCRPRAVGDNAPITPALAVRARDARARWVARRAHLHGAAPRTNQRGERAVHGDGDGDGQARAVARRCDRAWRSRRGRSHDAGENGVSNEWSPYGHRRGHVERHVCRARRERSARLFRHDGRRRQHRRSELHRHWRGGRHLLAPAA